MNQTAIPTIIVKKREDGDKTRIIHITKNGKVSTKTKKIKSIQNHFCLRGHDNVISPQFIGLIQNIYDFPKAKYLSKRTQKRHKKKKDLSPSFRLKTIHTN